MIKYCKIPALFILTVMIFSGCSNQNPAGTAIPSASAEVPHSSIFNETIIPEYSSLPMETGRQEQEKESAGENIGQKKEQSPQVKQHIPGQNRHMWN